MSLRDAAEDVAAVLEAASVGSTTATPPTLYTAPFPSAGPDVLVSVVDFGTGEDVELFLGGAGRAALAPEVTVRVRGERSRYQEARTLATMAWEALWYAEVTGYVRIVPQGAGPTYLGPDPSGRHQFSFTVRCEYRATTSAGTVTPDA